MKKEDLENLIGEAYQLAAEILETPTEMTIVEKTRLLNLLGIIIPEELEKL